jgi:hypothetical protein
VSPQISSNTGEGAEFLGFFPQGDAGSKGSLALRMTNPMAGTDGGGLTQHNRSRRMSDAADVKTMDFESLGGLSTEQEIWRAEPLEQLWVALPGGVPRSGIAPQTAKPLVCSPCVHEA